MKLVHLIFGLFILLTSCLVSPTTSTRVGVPKETRLPEETLTRYREFIPSDERIIQMNYQTVITELPDGNFRKRIFYPEKYQCTDEVTYFTGEMKVKNGSLKEWWDEGYQKETGQYKHGLKVGDWKSYSKDGGKLTKEVSYVEGKKQDTEKNYEDDILVSTYEYNMGIKEGPFTIYDSLGILINDGEYKADTIFNQTIVIETHPEVFKVVEEMPRFPGCEDIEIKDEARICAQTRMLKFIYGGIRYPSDAREKRLQGSAVIRFVVDKDGSIKDVQAIKGLSQTIEAECLRIINAMPVWNPGMQDGKPVEVQFTLPIKFRLQ